MQDLVQKLTEQAKADGLDQLATGAAILSDGKILLVTRADDEEIFPKCVELPGGSVDPGENLLEAVGREMLEETGLESKTIVDYVGSFDFVLKDGRKVRQFNFLIEPKTTAVRLNPIEHSSFYWLDVGDLAYLDSILITPLMKTCIMDICRRIVP